MIKLKNLEREKDVILVVDDEVAICSQLKWALAGEYTVLFAQNTAEAIHFLETEIPNLVTLDISLSSHDDTDGISVLEKILNFDPQIKVIMITGNDEKKNALKAIQLGAYDYYQKPIDIDELKVIIKRALYIQKLELENEALAIKLSQEKGFDDFIGDCPQMLEVYDIIKKVVSSDVPVFIYGESGTGKELVARAIHYQGVRKDKPFIPINCGAIPETLLESELFGHERGSFTGAYYQKKGKFELADGGTAFLDEIGELSPALQVKLLRFLQDKEVERIGGKYSLPIDVRIISATNKNLEEEIKKQNFRIDLYYRIGVIMINLPPLRQRGDDIVLLAISFLNKYAKEYGKNLLKFDSGAMERMKNYQWPGNVRELENRIKRAVIISQNNLITSEDLGLPEKVSVDKESLTEIIDNIQRKYIEQALYQTEGNVAKAARELGISRVTLYDLLSKFKFEVNKYRKKYYYSSYTY